MKEEFITFETAKLAYEKGFNWSVLQCYSENGELGDAEKFILNNFNGFPKTKGSNTNLYSAPTQSLLQKWLREIYKIDIMIEPCIDTETSEEFYEMTLVYMWCEENCPDGCFDTYEEALEKGLEEALKLI